MKTLRLNTKCKELFRLVVGIAACIILTRCANESVPQGGKKDDKPPVVKRSTPENKNLHFKGDKIQITFDEFIKASGFSQTLISPPLDKRPDYKLGGKTLTIKFKSALRDSTTYTINFAEDIKDVNEGNIANNFTYVFSTGDYIDSQKVSGNVLLAKDNSLQEGIIVALYPENEPMGIVNTKPYYFTKTNKSGQFEIQNVREARYQVFGLKDQNYNYEYDQPNELIGFSDSILDLTDTLPKNVTLNVFEEARGFPILDFVSPIETGHFRLAYTKPVRNFRAEGELISNNDFFYYNEANDTIDYWYSKYYQEKGVVAFTVNDTLKDTARFELKFIPKDTLYRNKALSLSIVNQSVKASSDTSSRTFYNAQELFKPLKIKFTRPVVAISESKVLQVLEDSSKKSIPITVSIDPRTRLFLLSDFEKKENTKYSLEIPDSMFQDILATWNGKTVYRFQTNSKDSYGNIHLTMKAADVGKNYIIRLMNAGNEIVKEMTFSGEEQKVNIDNILSGSYKFVVIDDRNKNGKWDTGDFKNRIQPEKVFTIKDTYQLKGGWDLDVQVNF